jgi:hypothetical protein
VLAIVNTVAVLVLGGFVAWMLLNPTYWFSYAEPGSVRVAIQDAQTASEAVRLLNQDVGRLERRDTNQLPYLKTAYGICILGRNASWQKAEPLGKVIGTICDVSEVPEEADAPLPTELQG